MKKFTIFSIVAVFAMALAGCSTATNTTTNTNTRTNANLATNSNVAVVVNNNSNLAANSGITNTMNSNISRADYDRDKDRYSREAKEAGSTIGSGLNDGWIWTKTRAALLAADDLPESGINVDVANDVVTLRGTVATAAQKTQAETIAKGIEGVKSVTNRLTVSPGGSTTNTSGANTANANKR
ncbi:MAG TPA: BON domain-containing protein [Pyrinomonadaceae bacterium]|jgi:hypothetical protein